MKRIKVSIKGTSPLLMNQYNVQAELDRQKGKRINKVYDPTEEAEKAAYFSTKGKKELIIPVGIIYAAILNASSFHKIGKRSAKSILAGSLRIQSVEGDEEIRLGTDKYTVDTRPVVIQRNRVLKSRARSDEWKATFYIVFNENLIAEPTVIKTVLEEAGLRIGLCDFRPARGGWYGCFAITEWKEEK